MLVTDLLHGNPSPILAFTAMQYREGESESERDLVKRTGFRFGLSIEQVLGCHMGRFRADWTGHGQVAGRAYI